MRKEYVFPPKGRDPGPTAEQLAMRKNAAERPGYVTRRWMRDFPRHLYKYMSFQSDSAESVRNLRSIVVSSNFWLTSPEDFNDPFDMKSTFLPDSDRAAVRRGLQKLGRFVKTQGLMAKADIEKSISFAMQNLDSVVDGDMMNRRRKHHGVTCLTPHPKSLLMWAHYAQSHRGICLQFQTSVDPGLFGTAAKVDYSDEYPVVHWPSYPDNEAKAALYRKGSAWAYEDERRIIVTGLTNRLLGVAPRALTGIILGCRFPDEQRAGLEKILVERQAAGHPPVKILKATMKASQYGIRCIREGSP